jgi:hypothetical protein
LDPIAKMADGFIILYKVCVSPACPIKWFLVIYTRFAVHWLSHHFTILVEISSAALISAAALDCIRDRAVFQRIFFQLFAMILGFRQGRWGQSSSTTTFLPSMAVICATCWSR